MFGLERIPVKRGNLFKKMILGGQETIFGYVVRLQAVPEMSRLQPFNLQPPVLMNETNTVIIIVTILLAISLSIFIFFVDFICKLNPEIKDSFDVHGCEVF